MIVTCERCATQFQLDDTRVPDGGVRVRCSRCKHAFEIHKSKPAPPPAASDDEESDWQFNEDPPRGGPSGSAASVVDDLLGAGGAAGGEEDGESLFGDSSSSGLELRDDPPPAGGPEPRAAVEQGPSPAVPPHKPKPSAGPARDASPIAMPEAGASGLDLEGDPVPVAPRTPPAIAEDPADGTDEDPALDAGVEDPVSDLASELAEELGGDADGSASLADAIPEVSKAEVSKAEASKAEAAPEPASDELSSKDWDLLADGDPELGSARPRALNVDPDELIDDRPAWQSGLERAGQVVGWLAVAGLLALGLHGGLLPASPVSAAGPPATSEAGGVELRDVSGRFVDHVEAGTVYVISGRLTNTGSRPVSAGTLAVEVLDQAGMRLAPPAQAAAPLSAEAIREGRLSGPWRRSPALQPGEWRSFEAVLGPLPAGAQRFNLTTVDSNVANAERKPPPRPAGARGATGAAGAAPEGTDPDSAPEAAGVAVAGESPAATGGGADAAPAERHTAPPAAPRP